MWHYMAVPECTAQIAGIALINLRLTIYLIVLAFLQPRNW